LPPGKLPTEGDKTKGRGPRGSAGLRLLCLNTMGTNHLKFKAPGGSAKKDAAPPHLGLKDAKDEGRRAWHAAAVVAAAVPCSPMAPLL